MIKLDGWLQLMNDAHLVDNQFTLQVRSVGQHSGGWVRGRFGVWTGTGEGMISCGMFDSLHDFHGWEASNPY